MIEAYALNFFKLHPTELFIKIENFFFHYLKHDNSFPLDVLEVHIIGALQSLIIISAGR